MGRILFGIKKSKQSVEASKGSRRVAKVPVIMQMETLECGAACLAMILAYYGRWVTLEQLREDCAVSRDGSTAINVMRAARSYGMIARGYRFEPETLRKKGTFPCIIHWNFNHFVVLNGFKNGKAYINDPGSGNIAVSMKEFGESFTGICIFMRPGEDFREGGKKASVLSFASSSMHGAYGALALVIITTFIACLTGILMTGMSRVFMDQILTGYDSHLLSSFLSILVFIATIQIVTGAVQAIFLLRMEGKTAAVSNTGYMWHILHLPMRFFSQRMAGDLQQRQQMSSIIAASLIETLAPAVIQAVMLVFYFIVMIRYSVSLTMIGVAGILLEMILARVISGKRINITRKQLMSEAKLQSATVAGVSMIETIKASGAENGFFSRWSGYQASANAQEAKYAKLDAQMGVLPQLVNRLISIFVIGCGAFLTMKGDFTVGMLLAFQGFLTAFTEPAMTLIGAGQTLQEMRTNMERIQDVFDYPEDLCFETTEAKKQDTGDGKLMGEVELECVTFGYSPLAEPLIKDFSMHVRRGGSVALVGASGCGKSTLAKLISGLYQPWSGRILLDNRNINEIDRYVLTGSLAVVDQDITLFEDTISNNIRMWDGTIEDFEVIMAARDAQIHETIMQRGGGYRYKMSESGSDFSGGERQRLEIARVLAQDPRIIILDEATSALDAQTEADVVRSIRDRGVTLIVVAHRLSTIRDCDEIIVLDHGDVAERGTHEELFALNGKYTELVTSE